MRNLVVAGGTDGIGRAVALARVAAGDAVLVIGRDVVEGKGFLEEAAALGAAERAHFVAADLSSVAATREAMDAVRARFSTLDALVLTARHHRQDRLVTAEGFEYTFALSYLSRFLLSYELTDLLDGAERPLIVNVAAAGSGTDRIRWDDLGYERDYDGTAALSQTARLNDLLGVEFARRPTSGRTRYVLVRHTENPVDDTVRPILAALAQPPADPLTAIVGGSRIDIRGTAFDAEAAARLYDETIPLLGRLQSAALGISPARLREVLDGRVFATVATIQPDGSPQQSVVWVLRDGDDVLFAIGAGSRKERNLRRDPRVGVLLNPPGKPYTYAAIHGKAVLSAEGGVALRDRLALKYTGMTYLEHNPDAAVMYGDIPMIVVRVKPERIVGRL
ncbi:TIGR03618 family F420-dependent PPOX class oxidoreductase [Nocardia sp. NPDC004860]|uniref:TIGR03618 family F420-dependent PPOX class oxidoreductase n=1 Tax=Nocardia sp. NPDC004860 TaxID=3154557 RepID=UPI0033B69E38